jgi:hypothetical protein
VGWADLGTLALRSDFGAKFEVMIPSYFVETFPAVLEAKPAPNLSSIAR